MRELFVDFEGVFLAEDEGSHEGVGSGNKFLGGGQVGRDYGFEGGGEVLEIDAKVGEEVVFELIKEFSH